MIYRVDTNNNIIHVDKSVTLADLDAVRKQIHIDAGAIEYIGDTSLVPDSGPYKFDMDGVTIIQDVDAKALNDKEVIRKQAQTDRDTALQAITHTFADGSVVQVRPQDLSNFQLAIAQGVDREWVMEDNTVRMTTVAELTEAMNSGITQGEIIWSNYINSIKVL